MSEVGTTTVAFTEEAWSSLVSALDLRVESAWMLTARLVDGSVPAAARTLLVRGVYPVPDDAYEIREADRLSIRGWGWVPALSEAAQDDCVPIFVHTHPNHDPEPSHWDDTVDGQISGVTAVRNGTPYAALVLGGMSDSPRFTGRIADDDNADWTPIDRIRVTGQRLTIVEAWNPEQPHRNHDIFDRQIRAFGDDGQELLERLRVGVIGAGGTGSAVCEQLLRLGVGELIVLDHQDIEETNVTRVYGSRLTDAGTAKVALVERQTREIGLGTTVHSVQDRITTKDAARALMHCDIVFGCTDDNAGRLIATRLPQFMLQHLIDCAIVIDSREQTIHDVVGRVSVVGPGSPCLVCMREVDLERAAAEQLSPDEYAQRAHEGYVPNLDTRDPAVVTFTTMVASSAVNELLARLFGYGDLDQPNRLLLRIGDRSTSRTRRERQGKHSCGDARLLGAGEADPFLNWGWSS